MKSIKVSIIVPIYNVEKYLVECIESILNQIYENIEIILVDDGSPDSCADIIESYALKDKRIKTIHQENSGVSVARNIGIEKSTGDYICFVDPDDILSEEYVEYLVRMAIENDADLVMTKEWNTTFNHIKTVHEKCNVYTNEKAIVELLCYMIPIAVWCKMYKRELIGVDVRFNKDLFMGEGFCFNSIIFQKANKIVVGNKRVYFQRRDVPTSATTEFSVIKWENSFVSLDEIKRNLSSNNQKINTAWQYAYWHTNCDAYNSLLMADKIEMYPELYSSTLRNIRRLSGCVLKVNISFKERLRAFIMILCPSLMSKIICLRYKIYGVIK